MGFQKNASKLTFIDNVPPFTAETSEEIDLLGSDGQ